MLKSAAANFGTLLPAKLRDEHICEPIADGTLLRPRGENENVKMAA